MIYVGSTPVLTYGEFSELANLLPDDFSDETLTAMYFGGDVYPDDARAALDVSVRLAASNDDADTIIDRALARLDS
jgi:hypothetical protein